jgi:hypothetical protein
MISQLTTQTAARTVTSLRGKFQPVGSRFSVGTETLQLEAHAPKAYSLEHFMSADASCHSVTSDEWSVYRTRFLVRAKQLTETLVFTDALGREHRGAPGDYVVQSSEGLLRIAPREIFEDVYVPMRPDLTLQTIQAGNLASHARSESLSA